MNKLTLNLVAAALALSLTGFAWAQEKAGVQDIDRDIVAKAAVTAELSTFVKAVKAAELAETLAEAGPITCFAPNNEAFKKLPEEALAELLKPAKRKELVALLKYHVLSSRRLAADVAKLDSAETEEGSSIDIKAVDGEVLINKAKVLKADIPCTNGVIHIIDRVLMPPSEEVPAGEERAVKGRLRKS